MSLQTAAGPINAEDADNFEEIEKQFAVKGVCVCVCVHIKYHVER